MNVVTVAAYAVAAAGIVAGVVAWALRGTARDPLGPRAAGEFPASAPAVLVLVGAWLLGSGVAGYARRDLGMTSVEAATAAFALQSAVAAALLRTVRRGAPEPALGGGRLAGLGVAGGVVAFGVGTLLTGLLLVIWDAAGVEKTEQGVVTAARAAAGTQWAAQIVMGAVLAPFFEEVLWRGALLPALATRMPAARAVTVQALAFGVVHVAGAEPKSWPLALPLAAVGWIAGTIYLRTASLPAAFLVHATFNALNLAVLRLGGA